MGIYLNPNSKSFSFYLNGKVFIDKTGLLSETNSMLSSPQRFICQSRPRRFGKTMAADMMTGYYSKGADSASVFDNLKIAEFPNYREHLNKHNVIRINMSDFFREGVSCKDALNKLNTLLVKELNAAFGPIDTDCDTLPLCLDYIYGTQNQQFIFIIDEWDQQLRYKPRDKEGKKLYLDFLKTLLKDKDYVELAYMTGIFPIKKYGTHSALNMFDEYTIIDPGIFAEYFGFTSEEVQNICKEHNLPFEEMKKWYDGYRLKKKGDFIHIYNPRSVVAAVQWEDIKSYWGETESYKYAIGVYLDMDFKGLKEKILTLMTGKSIPVRTSTFTNDISELNSPDDVLTMLIHLGYLTLDGKNALIPNFEIEEEFVDVLNTGENWGGIPEAVQKSGELFNAIWEGNEKRAAELVEFAHSQYTSIFEYKDENSLACVLTIALLNYSSHYTCIRETYTGKGRTDFIFVPHRKTTPLLIVELKYGKSAEEAIEQIKQENYIQNFAQYKDNAILVGINYDGDKHHTVKIEKYSE